MRSPAGGPFCRAVGMYSALPNWGWGMGSRRGAVPDGWLGAGLLAELEVPCWALSRGTCPGELPGLD